MNEYKSLSQKTIDLIKNNKASAPQPKCVRRFENHDKENILRPAFVRDTEKILNSPYYNRYGDKTQVISLYKNDDISRRSFHVQLVSRIARNIGRLLNLNCDLIEAISLGHDIGHTPFGHAGEDFLNEQYSAATGRYFNHNVHSVRVLDGIFKHNISMQTLDGILCHNGEFELQTYIPSKLSGFDEFDLKVEKCYKDKKNIKTLIASTLEGCVVRISDMIAYIGKDRQDAVRAGIIPSDKMFGSENLGTFNAVIINNLIVSIVENSIGKNYIMLDPESYRDLKTAKAQNNEFIYQSKKILSIHDDVHLMFEKIYKKIICDLKNKNKNSPVYKHHINFVLDRGKYYLENNYEATELNQIAADYIAAMTDDYFVDLFSFWFPESKIKLNYVSYFEDLIKNS